MEEGFERSLAREFLQATVNVSHYKGAMLLSVLPELPKKGEKHRCSCPSIQYPSAWLRGDDLDALIRILREAKRVWLRAYRKAAREVVKHDKAAREVVKRKMPRSVTQARYDLGLERCIAAFAPSKPKGSSRKMRKGSSGSTRVRGCRG